MAKKKRPAAKPARGGAARAAGLRKAEALLDRDRWPEARALLTDLARRHPRDENVLALLLEAAALSGDLGRHHWAGERLVELRPADAELRLVVAGSYAADNWPGLALRHYRAALALLPPGPDADNARKAAVALTAMLRDLAPRLGQGDDERAELAALHEQMQLALNRHDYPAVCDLGGHLLARQPDFAPALNNMSEAHWRAGHPAEAIACARRVLDFAPDNAFALASLARFLALTGRGDEARPLLD